MLVELPCSFLTFEKDFTESLRHIAITDLCCLFKKYDTHQRERLATLLKNRIQTLEQLLTDPITNDIITSAIFITDEDHPLSVEEDDWHDSFHQLYEPSSYGEYHDFSITYYWLAKGESPTTRIKKNQLFSADILNNFITWCVDKQLITKNFVINDKEIETQFSRLITNEINITDMPVYDPHQADFLLRLAYLYGQWTEKVQHWIYGAIKNTHSENTLLMLFKSGFDHQSITTPILCQSNLDAEKKIVIDLRNLNEIDTSSYTKISTPATLKDLFVFINTVKAEEFNESSLNVWLNKWFHDDDFLYLFIDKLTFALLYANPTVLINWKVPKHFHCNDCACYYAITEFYKNNNIVDIFLKLSNAGDKDEILNKALERLNADEIFLIMSNYTAHSQKNTFYTCVQYNCVNTIETIIEKVNEKIIELIRPIDNNAIACKNDRLRKKLNAIIVIIDIFQTYLNPPFLSWLAKSAISQEMEADLEKIKDYLTFANTSAPCLSTTHFMKQVNILKDCINQKLWSKTALLSIFAQEAQYHLTHTEKLNLKKQEVIFCLTSIEKHVELKPFC